MPSISNLISSVDHVCIIKYTLEYCLCGKKKFIVCAKIGRGIRTPAISIKGKNIWGELLQRMDLPVIELLNKAHLLSINKTRAYIDKNITSLEELMRNLPAVKEDTTMKKMIAKGN